MSILRLNNLINNENRVDYMDYTLDNITEILDDFGNPHNNLNTIHISGTNGKGSAAYLLNSIFVESGYKTGLYTSPHLLYLNERIKINNVDISDDELNRYLYEVFKYLDNNKSVSPTYFDVITLVGFKYFYDYGVDVAIIETGLGGRLDSTNVVTPLCSIITEISSDHTAILGNSIKKISVEKAGIIKKNIPVITSNTDPEVIKIISSRAKSLNSELLIKNKDFSVDNVIKNDGGYIFDYELNRDSKITKITDIIINSPARFQVYNSALAITGVMTINSKYNEITDINLKKGINNFIIPGRFQILSNVPLIIFDPAHNLSALMSVIELLRENYYDKKITIILSMMQDKDYRNIILKIIEFGASIIYYEIDDDRCYKASEYPSEHNLDEIVNSEFDLKKILTGIKSKDSLFFFTGSFRLYEIALNYSYNS